MIPKITKRLKNYELVMAIREIEEWMNTGILKKEGVVQSLHTEIEGEVGSKHSLSETRNAILLEASKRFIQILK